MKYEQPGLLGQNGGPKEAQAVNRRWRQRWLPVVLILGAPALAAAMSLGVTAAIVHTDPAARPLAYFAYVLNGLLAGAGAAVSPLLMPKSLTGRVVRAVLCFFAGFVWHWIILFRLLAVTGLDGP